MFYVIWTWTSEWGRKKRTIFSLRQYLENGRRYVQVTINCMCAFDWHQGRWPWM